MRKQGGFTLIELLVVVAIIGILAAIAIPQFSEYKVRAFNARAQSDLRNGLTAQEAYFVDHERYVDCADAGCDANLPGFRRSTDVEIAYLAYVNDSQFAAAACHSSGDTDFTWKSSGTNSNVIQTDKNFTCVNPTVPAIP